MTHLASKMGEFWLKMKCILGKVPIENGDRENNEVAFYESAIVVYFALDLSSRIPEKCAL